MNDLTVTISGKWVRRINSPLYLVVGLLSGVCITFFPAWLFLLGQRQIPFSDLRVILLIVTVYLVALFYFRLAHHVIRQVRNADKL